MSAALCLLLLRSTSGEVLIYRLSIKSGNQATQNSEFRRRFQKIMAIIVILLSAVWDWLHPDYCLFSSLYIHTYLHTRKYIFIYVYIISLKAIIYFGDLVFLIFSNNIRSIWLLAGRNNDFCDVTNSSEHYTFICV